MYIHVHEFIYLYVHCTYTCIDVVIYLDTAYTCLCNFTATLHFPSEQPWNAVVCQHRAGASPSEKPPSWHQSFHLKDHQAWLATPKHSHGFTSCTLLPPWRWPSAAAVSQLPTGKPDLLCWLYCWGMVGVKLPARNKGNSWTLPTIFSQLVKTCMYIAYSCTLYTCTYTVHG